MEEKAAEDETQNKTPDATEKAIQPRKEKG